MKAIWKFQFDLQYSPGGVIPLSKGAKFLGVGFQEPHVMSMWFEVDPNESEIESRMFEVYGTGQIILEKRNYRSHHLGSAIDEEFDWHLYEVLEIPPKKNLVEVKNDE